MLGAVAKLVFLSINCFVLVAGLLMIIFGMTFYFSPYLHLPDLVERSEKYSEDAGYTLPKQLRDMKEFPIANEFGLALALVGMFLALLSLMAILVVCLTCGDIFYIVYALLVFLMVVAEITLCILFLNSNSVLHKNIKEDLKEKVRNEYVDQGNDTFSETLNLIHVYFQCCGITGESDFGGKSSQSCRAHNQTMGCYTKLMEEIQKNLAWITTILLLLILLQSLRKIEKILEDNGHPLHQNYVRSSRSGRLLSIKTRTERYKNSFVPHSVRLYHRHSLIREHEKHQDTCV